MAFDVTAQNPTFTQVIGTRISEVIGVGTLVAGTLTITVPQFSKIIYANASSHTSNACRISATTSTSITVTGTSTDTFMYVIKGNARIA